MYALEKLPFARRNAMVIRIALIMRSALMSNVNQAAQMIIIVNLGSDVFKIHAWQNVNPAKIVSLRIIVILITRFVT